MVSFGSHTSGHPILTHLQDTEVRNELNRSLAALRERKLVNRFVPFCYPNGSFTPEIRDMVEQCGYSLAVTTQRGWTSKDDNLFQLKRIGLHEDISHNNYLLMARLSELF